MDNPSQEFYALPTEECEQRLHTSLTNGLTSQEAAARLAQNGANEFEKKKHTSLLVKFLNQFKSFMIIVLLAAAAVSAIVGVMNGEGFTDAIIILVIVVINAIIGVFQEAKAEKSLEALERMSAPQCKAIRNGEMVIVPSRELVVGDVVVVETGDSIPADLRIVEATNLKVQEAALTGESVPVEKSTAPIEPNAAIGDRTNMLFGSCSVTYGRGKGVVVATGARSEVGKIAAMIQSVGESKTPMQIRLDKLGKVLAIVAVGVCAAIFVVGGLIYHHPLMEMFMTAVSMAAAAIPEGLPAVSTIVLAMGVQRLAQQRAIVRNLPSVETLGSTTVICSDKTGTLTQNRMTVVKVATLNGTAEPNDTTNNAIEELCRIGAMANDATISREEGETKVLGDPTETAIVSLWLERGCDKEQQEELWPRVGEVPFDSERKLMSTIHRNASDPKDNKLRVYVKGGMDELLARCSHIVDNGTTRPITDSDKATLASLNLQLAGEALRVLAMASAQIDKLPEVVESQTVEQGLTFVGMVGMIDPPRAEVKVAVEQCLQAGIRPVMITGDHLITASAIGRSLGIMHQGDNALTGADVERMSDQELQRVAPTTSIFARVAPEHKVRIVEAYQKNGNVVAMTGDGVNDAPALKLADIGVAMGITGTDVSKEAADVVLADDNFATIVEAVGEGRRIYDNLLKSIQFMLSTNFGEILVLFIAIMAGFASPLLPIHILWINLVTDSLPALALSFDPAESDIMRRKPINPTQGIMTRSFTLRTLLQGLLVATATLVAYVIGAQSSVTAAQTMAFATLALSQMTLIFSIRSGMHAAIRGLLSNKFLWGAIAFVVGLMAIVLFVPALQEIFHVCSLTDSQWMWVGLLAVAVLVVSEAVKFFLRAIRK